jgi:hypothetical protein
MKTVYMTLSDYENYLETGFPLYYDSPKQLYDYEGDVPFKEVLLFDINEN